MADVITIEYRPRPQSIAYHNREQRWACSVAHRRFGKTVREINELIKRAAICALPNPRFAYLAPYYGQAKAIAWDYLKQYARPITAGKPMESELSVQLVNGAKIRLFGADNPDALRGLYLDGVVLDEYGDMRPSVWGEIIRPLLADRKGWASFIGTPKGKNHFHELAQQAKGDSAWFYQELRASDTGIVDAGGLGQATGSDARLPPTVQLDVASTQIANKATTRFFLTGQILLVCLRQPLHTPLCGLLDLASMLGCRGLLSGCLGDCGVCSGPVLGQLRVCA